MNRAAVLVPLLVASTLGCGAAPRKAESTPARAAPADGRGSVEERLARLEASWATHAEALDFLNQVYAQQKAQMEAQAREEHDPDAMFAVDIARDVAAGKVDGPATASVTIIKAFDFACPYCQRMSSVMDDLVKEYAGKVRVVYMDLVVHPDTASKAHLAACGAAKQGKYKEFKTAVWNDAFLPYMETRDASKMGAENLLAIGKRVGLDARKLEADMNGPECMQLIQADMAELERFKVNGTPGFFINGKFVGGALPKEAFQQIVDEQLKIAEASGAGAGYYDKVVMANGLRTFKSAVE